MFASQCSHSGAKNGYFVLPVQVSTQNWCGAFSCFSKRHARSSLDHHIGVWKQRCTAVDGHSFYLCSASNTPLPTDAFMWNKKFKHSLFDLTFGHMFSMDNVKLFMQILGPRKRRMMNKRSRCDPQASGC